MTRRVTVEVFDPASTRVYGGDQFSPRGRFWSNLLEGFSYCGSDVTARFCIRCLGDVFNSTSVVIIETLAK
jgi:hypothetical protein